MADRSVLVRLRADISDFQRGMRTSTAEAALLERQLESVDKRGGAAIDRLSGRLRLFADAAAIFGPGAAPVGGVLAAGVGGFASQLGFAAVAGGVLAGSMQGLGDALGAMNKAQLEPTDKNLEAAHDAIKRLSPATRDLARELFALKPALVAIRDIGAESLAPGLTESLDSLEEVGPRVAGIFEAIAAASGEIAADSAASIASDRWADFFTFLETEGPQALQELAAAVGDVTHGLAELWMAFEPLNSDFSGWLMEVAAGFDGWASGLSATEGFRDFIDYVRETGPQVADTTGALASAIVQIVQAAAPLGGPVLAAVEAFANGLAAIADSDLGTPIMVGVTALSLYNRTLAVTQSLQKRIDGASGGGLFGAIGSRQGAVQSSFAAVRKDVEALGSTWMTAGARTTREQERMAASAKSLRTNLGALTVEGAKAAAPVAGLAVVASGAADGIGLTNTASLALMGSLAGPWGAAIGGGVGLLLDLKSAGEGATAAIDGLGATAQSGNIDALKAQIASAKAELADINNLDFSGGDIFDRIKFQWADTFGGTSADEAQQKIEDAKKAVEELTKAEQLRELQSRASAISYASEVGLNVELSTWRTKSVEEIKAQADALAAVREEGSKTGQSFLQMDDSISKAKATLGDFIGQMNETTDAMANFNTNSLKAAKNGIDEGLIASLRKLGPEGAVQLKNLANATEEQVDRANKAYRRQQRELERTIDVTAQLAGYSPIDLKVNTNTSGAMKDIEGLEARLRAIKDETVNVVVRQINPGDTQLGPRGGVAEGGTIPGQRYPYGDKHLYMLAPGEEVISNRFGQADKHRPLLKAINGGLANGGTAGKKVKRDFSVVDDTETEAQRRRREAREAARDRREADLAANEERRQAAAERDAQQFLAVIEGQERAARSLIDAAETQKAAAESVRDGWAQAMERTGQAATAGFKSDLFGQQRSGLWSGPGGGSSSWMDALSGDIAGLQQRSGLIQELSNRGVTGSALEALLSQGSNADLSRLIESGQTGQFAAMFAQREALLGSVSQQAGQAAYGAEFAAASQAVAALGGQLLVLQEQLAAITAQRPITVYEAISAAATAAEVARLQALAGVA